MTPESCTVSVCAAAREAIDSAYAAKDALEALQDEAEALDLVVSQSGQALQCVINGPEGATCRLPLGGRLPTLAEALAELNETSVGGISTETFTAVGGESMLTLSLPVSGPQYLELALDGAFLQYATDYNVSGATVILSHPLVVGDLVSARIFSL